MSNAITQKLQQASDGLLFISESESPFQVIFWEKNAPATLEKILELTGSPGLPIEVVDLDYLFRNCAVEKDWHDDVQKAEVAKFKQLVEVINNNLTDVKVYRIGRINIDAYIVGETATGDLVGLVTKLVET
ncbi:MAG TPA: nuclease A inhibitor family protein [Nostocaceae cyanobacterium]|nr:nuclease A inhibitor family protein [Nostocaceae cyanobacterium]